MMFEDQPSYGPPTKTQALSEVMKEKAKFHGITDRNGTELEDISLLLEALDTFGMKFDDLKDDEFRELDELEGGLFREYLTDYGPDDEPEDTEGGYSPSEPEFWGAIGERLGFKDRPDPNQTIRSALASEAFVRQLLDDEDTPILATRTDGTITEEPRGER